ncbi:MAG: BatD family protein [Planctomycetes bacterium]|nr:BatD family protein [Planctomycetota bacterium]
MRTRTIRALLLAVGLAGLAPAAASAAASAPASAPGAASPAAAQQGGPRITANLSTGVVKLGGTVNCVVQVEGAKQASLVRVPEVEGLKVERQSGPSINESFSLVGGRNTYSRTITWVVTLRPLELGEYAIPPMQLEVDGRVETTRELSLSVVQDLDGQELGRLAFVSVPERVYEGQPFTIRMEFGWDKQLDPMVNTANLILPWWNELPGTLELEDSAASLGQRMVEVNVNARLRARAVELGDVDVEGKPFRMLSLTRSFVATRAGRLDVTQSWLEFGRVTRRAFSEARETYHTGAPAFAIDVVPLPEAGRPFDFSGGVGSFQASAEVSRRDVDVGESIKLTVDWTGDANLEFFELPDPSRMAAFDGFRVYGKSGEHFYGDRRRVVYDIAPLSAQVQEVPALPLVIFDPELERYRTVSTQPIPLRVRALEGGVSLEELDTGGERGLAHHDLQTEPESNRAPGGVSGALVLASWLGLPVLWLGLRTAVRRHGAPDAPAARARARGLRRLRRELRGARGAGAQAHALHVFLGARSGEEPEAWEGRDLAAWSGAAAHPELVAALAALEADLDRSRWAGDDAPVDAARLTDFARRWTQEGL